MVFLEIKNLHFFKNIEKQLFYDLNFHKIKVKNHIFSILKYHIHQKAEEMIKKKIQFKVTLLKKLHRFLR